VGHLAEAIADLKEDEVRELVQRHIADGADPSLLLAECRLGMDIVGQRYRAKEYFLSELIISGQIFKDAMKIVEPLLLAQNAPQTSVGVVLGTVKGDIHDLGKDIVGTLLKGSGFEVHDLGVDVPPQRFVEKLVETQAPILALSGLITPAFDSMKQTVEALRDAGLRDRVKVIIGGGIVTRKAMEYVGADAFSDDAAEGVEICRELAGRVI